MTTTTKHRRGEPTWGVLALLVSLVGVGWGGFPVTSQASEVQAVLTRAAGHITVHQGGSLWRLHPYDKLSAGMVVQLKPEGTRPARAALVCSTEHFIQLEGTPLWIVTEAACRQGQPLAVGTYRAVLPQVGRVVILDKFFVLQPPRGRETASTDDVPVLLSPRHTALMEPRPLLQWTQVPQAIEYEITLTGHPAFTHRLRASEVTCQAEGLGSGTLSVCSTPFPPDRPELVPGSPAFLRVEARLSLTTQPPSAPEGVRLDLLTPEQRAKVTDERARLATVPVDDTTRQLLMARLFAKHKLYADALATSLALLQQQESPEAYVMVGDLYLMTKLYPLALQNYHAARALSERPEIQAATAFGIGRVYYATARFAEALASFQQAAKLYTSLQAAPEAQAAQAFAAAARQRQPQ